MKLTRSINYTPISMACRISLAACLLACLIMYSGSIYLLVLYSPAIMFFYFVQGFTMFPVSRILCTLVLFPRMFFHKVCIHRAQQIHSGYKRSPGQMGGCLHNALQWSKPYCWGVRVGRNILPLAFLGQTDMHYSQGCKQNSMGTGVTQQNSVGKSIICRLQLSSRLDSQTVLLKI